MKKDAIKKPTPYSPTKSGTMVPDRKGNWLQREEVNKFIKECAPKQLCTFSGNCSKGDILSSRKPYEVVSSCDKWPKECRGGNYRCGGK